MEPALPVSIATTFTTAPLKVSPLLLRVALFRLVRLDDRDEL
jgi:hypothetical protein